MLAIYLKEIAYNTTHKGESSRYTFDMSSESVKTVSIKYFVAYCDVYRIIISLFHEFFLAYTRNFLLEKFFNSEELSLSLFKFASLETPGYVGFANLPNQVHRKSVKKGFEFTLMVVGESGLGKSTLVNSLFLTDLYPERIIPDAVGKH